MSKITRVPAGKKLGQRALKRGELPTRRGPSPREKGQARLIPKRQPGEARNE